MLNPLRLAALLMTMAWLTGSAPVSAQSPAAALGAIRCTRCPLSGQKTNASAFDESQVKFVGALRLAFHEDQAVQIDIIARVLLTSPFMVEVLDERAQTIDRNMRPVRQDVDDGNDHVCSITRIESVDLASKQTLASLRFNDVIAARLVMQRWSAKAVGQASQEGRLKGTEATPSELLGRGKSSARGTDRACVLGP